MVPTKVTKVGGIQKSSEMWQAGFSLAALPLAYMATEPPQTQESDELRTLKYIPVNKPILNWMRFMSIC